MALYLAGAYGVDQQTRELSDRDITTLLVEEGGEAIAYAQLRDRSRARLRHGPDADRVVALLRGSRSGTAAASRSR